MPPDSQPSRILLITRNYPPLTGGMERLMQKASEGLAQGARLTIIGPSGCTAFAPAGATVYEVRPQVAPFLLGASWKAMELVREQRFERVIGGSGLVAPILRILQRLYGLPTAVFIHGLDIVVDNSIYQRLFVPAVCRADLIIANSQNTRRLAIARGAEAGKVSVINPGTEIPPPTAAPTPKFREKFGIPFERVMLFTGRITQRKGLLSFLQHALPDILAGDPDCGLVVAGDNPDDSLNQQGEQAQVQRWIRQAGLGQRVIFIGKVSDDDLLAAYRSALVQLFPLIDVDGDVEGFGMVAVEAAACGTPTVAFNLGGVADAILPDGGVLVPAGDYAAFAAAALGILARREAFSTACYEHSKRFGWPRFHRQLAELINLPDPAR